MDDLADADLIRSWRSGDQEAYAVLVARHHGLVRAACLRQAAPGETDDCVQAVFLVLSRRPAAAAAAPALAAWLLRVASFVCRRSRRAATRRQRAEQAAARESGRRGAVRPEALDHLDDCLLRLPEKQRTAVTLHYLAGKDAAEVATALGTSRDNAYQLLSRGLAGLRTLLARRGVAVGGAALASLLASEAQAASASAPAAVVATLTAAPSTGAATLASGAMTAMTVAAATPFAIAAGLLLAVGMSTAVLTAEAVPAPRTPAATPAIAVRQAPAGTSTTLDPAIAKALEVRLTVDFQDQDLSDALDFLRKVSGINIIIDPRIATAKPGGITFRADRMRLRDVLAAIGKLAGIAHTIHRDAIVVHLPGKAFAPKGEQTSSTSGASAASRPDPATARVLDTRITVDFQDQPLSEIAVFVRTSSGIDLAIDPALAAKAPAITLTVKDMRLGDLLKWIETFASAAHEIRGTTYVIIPLPAPGATTPAPRPKGQEF